jgi:hypothetical protein
MSGPWLESFLIRAAFVLVAAKRTALSAGPEDHA